MNADSKNTIHERCQRPSIEDARLRGKRRSRIIGPQDDSGGLNGDATCLHLGELGYGDLKNTV